MKKPSKSPRFRDEFKRTLYSSDDRREKLSTMKVIRYSDGREFQTVQMHNGYTKNDLKGHLDKYSSYLSNISRKLIG